MNGPAIGLIAAGAIGLVVVAPIVVIRLLMNGEEQLEELRREFHHDLGLGLFYAINAFFILLNLAASAFLVFAGLRMRQLKDWVVCVVACLVAIVPCWACCCVGIPVGVWGLVVLMKDDVKQAFTS